MNAKTLNNDVKMPSIGLGVFQTPPDVTTTVVEKALRLGYRHIDTAAAYGNEREVGEGIRRAELARDDVFIETKVWISSVQQACEPPVIPSSTLDVAATEGKVMPQW